MQLSHLFALALLAPPAQPAKTLAVDEIVARSVEARGGAAKLAAIQSLRLTGKVQFGGANFSIDAAYAVLVKRPGRIRSETTLQGLTAVEAYDGAEGWSVQPFQGRRDPQKTPAENLKSVAQEADFDGPTARTRQQRRISQALGDGKRRND